MVSRGYITIPELALVLGKTPNTLRLWIKREIIPQGCIAFMAGRSPRLSIDRLVRAGVLRNEHTDAMQAMGVVA